MKFPAKILGWTLFAMAFGYTEAILVVYLRQLLHETHGLDYRQIFASRGLPLTPASIAADMRRHGLYDVERSREAATLLLLIGAAWGGGRTRRDRCAIFLWTFAVWDETYYLFLTLWTGFPRGLSSVDIYFLLPVPSYGPVWFPVLIVMPCLIALAGRLWQDDAKRGGTL